MAKKSTLTVRAARFENGRLVVSEPIVTKTIRDGNWLTPRVAKRVKRAARKFQRDGA